MLGLGLPEAIFPRWSLPALGATGFWLGLAVGLSVAAVWLVLLLRRVSSHATTAPEPMPVPLDITNEGLA